jgi:hypothetical protein
MLRARFVRVFRSRYLEHVKIRPKTVRGFYWLQEEQNWASSYRLSDRLSYGLSYEPLFWSVKASCSFYGLSSLPSVESSSFHKAPSRKPSHSQASPSRLTLSQASLPVVEASSSSTEPSYSLCRPPSPYSRPQKSLLRTEKPPPSAAAPQPSSVAPVEPFHSLSSCILSSCMLSSCRLPSHALSSCILLSCRLSSCKPSCKLSCKLSYSLFNSSKRSSL